VEWVDASRSCPGIEGDIVCFARGDLYRVLLDWLGQHVPILSDDVEGVPMQVHWVHHHGIRTDEPDVDGLAVLDHNWLCIREALAVDHIVATRHGTNELGVFHIGMYGLLRLGSARAGIHDEGTIEAARKLGQVIVVTVIPVRPDILIMHGEIVDIGLAWLDGLLPNAWYTIFI